MDAFSSFLINRFFSKNILMDSLLLCMIEFDREMIIRLQDMRSPVSYFSKVFGFNGFVNFYGIGGNLEASVTYLREGKTMEELRKSIRNHGFELTERKAGVTVRISDECFICETVKKILSIKGAYIEVPVLVKDGDVIMRIKFFNDYAAILQREILTDANRMDYFSIDYLGPVREDKTWITENLQNIELRKLTFYVLPKNSFSLKYTKDDPSLKVEVVTRFVEKEGFLEVFYYVEGNSLQWESSLKQIALEYEKIEKKGTNMKIYYAKMREEGILIDPYKMTDLDLPFTYDLSIWGSRAEVSMIFEKNTLDSFFKSITRIPQKELEESELEIRYVIPYP
jgi:hypothetical protein